MANGLNATPYRFIPLGYHHLPLLRRWFDEPHVRQWYSDPSGLEDIADHVEESDVHPYLVMFGHMPIAYLQSYEVDGSHPYAAAARGAIGIDQFIGPTAFLGQGHGSAFIRAYLRTCEAEGVPQVIVDPKPNNHRAICAYRKAGFEDLCYDRSPEEGAVLLLSARLPMTRER